MASHVVALLLGNTAVVTTDVALRTDVVDFLDAAAYFAQDCYDLLGAVSFLFHLSFRSYLRKDSHSLWTYSSRSRQNGTHHLGIYNGMTLRNPIRERRHFNCSWLY